jgi:hypothetical protein
LSYQSVILAASGKNNFVGSFKKCTFLVNPKMNLLKAATLTNDTASNIVVALNTDEYDFFQSFEFNDNTSLVEIRNKTRGALATSGLCLDKLNNDAPIVIQSVDGLCFDLMDKFVKEMQRNSADGGVVVFPSNDPKYSYVRVTENKPIEFAEKQLIGSILWAILFQIKYMDNYYLSSAMNKLVFEGKNVSLYRINEESYFRFATEDEALDARERLGNRNFG